MQNFSSIKLMFRNQIILQNITYSNKPRNNGFDGSKHSCSVLLKSFITNIESERKDYKGTKRKSAIVQFFATLGSNIAGFYSTSVSPLDLLCDFRSNYFKNHQNWLKPSHYILASQKHLEKLCFPIRQ